MEIKFWIISQIIIDIVLVGVILFLFKLRHKREIEWRRHEIVLEKSAGILSEMEEVSQMLQKNLEEKRDLSHHIIGKLNQGILKAEESYRQLSKMAGAVEHSSALPNSPPLDNKQAGESIKMLMRKGFSEEEVSQILGIPRGEVELFHKLSSQKGSPESG